VRAFGALRDLVCKKAELECQHRVLEIKRNLLTEGLKNMSEMPERGGGDDEPPPRPVKSPTGKSIKGKSTSPTKSPEPAAAAGAGASNDGGLYDQSWFHGILARVKVNELLKDNPNCKPG
jgi:hypothetical protein